MKEEDNEYTIIDEEDPPMPSFFIPLKTFAVIKNRYCKEE